VSAPTDGRPEADRPPDPQPTTPGAHGLSIDLPEQGTGVRAARRAAARAGEPPAADERPLSPRPSRQWLAGFAAAVGVCVLAAGALVLIGVSTLRDSRAGRTVTSARPDEPGFEAFLEPTPTMAVTFVHEGQLDSVAVLSLGADDTGGGVVLIPAATLVGTGDLGTLALAHAFGGSAEHMRRSVEIVAGVGISELVVVDDARWAELVAPVAPLAVDNPDELDDFDQGPLTLAADEIGPYLRSSADDERDLSRLARHELVWEAWLAAVAAGGSAAVPGELDTGIGRFVRGLAAGPHQVRSLPVDEVENGDGGIDFAVRRDERAELMVSLVPYPTGTEFAPRTLVRLLDGTGDPDHVARVAPRVVAAEASIVVVGNATRFDHEQTEIRYHQPGQRGAAQRLRDALGAGEVIEDVRPIDSFDVTIVLGTDL